MKPRLVLTLNPSEYWGDWYVPLSQPHAFLSSSGVTWSLVYVFYLTFQGTVTKGWDVPDISL